MLSYQHMYHAGGLADVHKHVLLARALAALMAADDTPLLFAETHSGRGRYALDSEAARKTGEAAAGIDRLRREGRFARGEPYWQALKQLTAASPRHYPGSPLLAASMLRPQDRLWLWELHPQEHAALARLFADDPRVTIHRADGTVGLPWRLPPKAPGPVRGLVLIDPSYEVKAEYETMAGLVGRIRSRWPASAGLVWYPMLPARRHETMVDALEAIDGVSIHDIAWRDPAGGRGLYGSGVAAWGLPKAALSAPPFAPIAPEIVGASHTRGAPL